MKDAKNIIDQGGRVRAELMADLVGDALEDNTDCAKCCILDGFPRNLAEAQILEESLQAYREHMDLAIELSLDIGYADLEH